jgi:nucleoside-diphosphate-sugar epimerase
MEILVAGGHGKVALRLLRQLAQRGHRGRALIRNPDHVRDIEAVHAEPVLCDLETDDPRPHIGAAEAIVFAAGAGPGSGPERKRTVDYGGAKKLIDAARDLGVARFVMISSMGTEDIEHADAGMRPYLEAKRDADDELRRSGLDWTIVKPGHLTDAPGTGLIDAAPTLGRRGEIPREDVAAVLVACLDAPNTIRAEFEVLSGSTPIEPAVRAISGRPVEH